MQMPEITNNPDHPGVIVQQELNLRGLSQTDAAFMLRRPIKMINEICRGKKSISPQTACDLELLTGINALYWLQKQAAYDLSVERKRYSNQLKAKPERKNELVLSKTNKLKTQILNLQSIGMHYTEIASKLNLSENTVYKSLKRWEKESNAV